MQATRGAVAFVVALVVSIGSALGSGPAAAVSARQVLAVPQLCEGSMDAPSQYIFLIVAKGNVICPAPEGSYDPIGTLAVLQRRSGSNWVRVSDETAAVPCTRVGTNLASCTFQRTTGYAPGTYRLYFCFTTDLYRTCGAGPSATFK